MEYKQQAQNKYSSRHAIMVLAKEKNIKAYPRSLSCVSKNVGLCAGRANTLGDSYADKYGMSIFLVLLFLYIFMSHSLNLKNYYCCDDEISTQPNLKVLISNPELDYTICDAKLPHLGNYSTKNRNSPFSKKIGNQLNLKQLFPIQYQILKNFNPKLPYSDKFGPTIKNDPFSMKIIN